MAGRHIVSALIAVAAFGQQGETRFAPAPGARFTLTVEKTGLWSGRKHVFDFERYVARAVGDRLVEVEVEAASAVCRDTWISEKDRAKVLAFMLRDMLDVEHYPKLLFHSERVVGKGNGAFDVVGQLAVRGRERPVTVSVSAAEGSAGVSGLAIVRLKDYGLSPPKAALGTIGTKNEMTVSFRLLPTGSAR